METLEDMVFTATSAVGLPGETESTPHITFTKVYLFGEENIIKYLDKRMMCNGYLGFEDTAMSTGYQNCRLHQRHVSV